MTQGTRTPGEPFSTIERAHLLSQGSANDALRDRKMGIAVTDHDLTGIVVGVTADGKRG